jgi:hypothetical protein
LKKSGEAMSRIGITFEEVKKAIAELQGKQKNPTVDAIREILGTGHLWRTSFKPTKNQ